MILRPPLIQEIQMSSRVVQSNRRGRQVDEVAKKRSDIEFKNVQAKLLSKNKKKLFSFLSLM